MERPKWLIIIEAGDFRVENYKDVYMVYEELAVVQAEETQKLGARVLVVYKTLGT